MRVMVLGDCEEDNFISMDNMFRTNYIQKLEITLT